MLTAFSKALRSLDWKHALAEVALIVVGVLLALAVNNWKTDRQNRKTGLTLIRQIRSSVARDLSNLTEANGGFLPRKKRMEGLREHLNRNAYERVSMRRGITVVIY